MKTVLDSPTLDHAAWLVERRQGMEANEAAWLDVLAEFDAAERWRADGQLSGADWLVWRCNMARSTAFEKLRIAHALRRRPALAAAFAEGRISYSAVRAITRLSYPSEAVVDALIALAEHGTIADVQRAVRAYQLHDDQHRPDDDQDPFARRGVRLSRGLNGFGVLEAVVTDVEIEELAAALEAFIDRGAVVDAREDSSTATPLSPFWTRRADALMDLARVALAHAKDGHAMGADRYMVHAVIEPGRPDRARLIDGTPLDAAAVAMLACDCATVTHEVDGATPLRLGRKTRAWSDAQRRAIRVRDGGRCRFPGCGRRIADIHHLVPWEEGGLTDVANGALVCTRHHKLLHRGFSATGDANHELAFGRPDGSVIAASGPPAQRS